jgi:type IV pilus assembly protein PilO
MDISLTKLPWYAQIGAFVLLAFAGVGVFYYYFELPEQGEIKSREQQLKSIRADINKGLTTANQLDKFRGDVETLEAQLQLQRAELPEEKDAADLLRSLQVLAAKSDLTIKSFKPSPTVTKQIHAEWPISLELDGQYHKLAIFFDQVAKLKRIVNITAVEIKGKDRPDPNSTITVKCVATTFVLLDKPVAPKPAAAAAKKPA